MSNHTLKHGSNFTITPLSEGDTKFCEVITPSGEVLRYSVPSAKNVNSTLR